MPRAKKPAVTVVNLGDLTPDPKNARRHTPRNIGVIGDSLQETGAWRSIGIDEKGVVYMGNGVVEAAGERGMEKVIVVDAEGDQIVAVRRSNLTPEQKRKAALVDNRATDLSEFDADVLREFSEAGDDLSGLWTDDELAAMSADVPPSEWDEAMSGLRRDKDGFQQMTFTLTDDQVDTVKRALDRIKAPGEDVTGNPNGNGNALAAICADVS